MLTATISTSAQSDVRLPEKPKRPKYVEPSRIENGFWFALESGASSSLVFNHKNAQRATGSFVGGYMFSEFIKLGVGIGANYYFNNNDAMRKSNIECSMPIYIDARGSILSQEYYTCVGYWSVDIGGAIRDGFFFSPTIGLRIGQKRNSFIMGFNYTLQEIDAHHHYPNPVSFFGMKLGYEF